MTLPLMSFEPVHSALSTVDETTYFGIVFIFSPNSPSPSSTSTPTTTPACVVTPSETEGPYFVDERLNRSDITTDPSTGSRRNGAPLNLTFQVSRVGTGGCSALSGAQVAVWHCDAAGVYSDVAAQSTVGHGFLRGYQMTGADGIATFATIPGGTRGGRCTSTSRFGRIPARRRATSSHHSCFSTRPSRT